MSENVLPFASKAWLEHVFATPPVRKIKGRSKWTHRHALWLFHLNRLGYVESRNELFGALALEYLAKTGVIRRYKEQPFTTSDEFGKSTTETQETCNASQHYTPDFFAESPTGEKFVIEVKSARFISRSDEEDFERWKQVFGEFGFKYLLWTDKTPLCPPLRQNLLRMRRAAVDHFESDEVDRFMDLLKTKGPLPLWALYNFNCDIDLIGC